MRIILFIVVLFSCNTHKKSKLDLAPESSDTAMTKQLAQKKLDSLRATVTDSTFAIILDASLQVQKIEFEIQKLDTSENSTKVLDDLILKSADGLRLYELVSKCYSLALQHTSRSSDISYFKKELSIEPQKWLAERFTNKKSYEALISIFLLQKDIALISSIVYKADTDASRKELDESYNNLIENIRQSR